MSLTLSTQGLLNVSGQIVTTRGLIILKKNGRYCVSAIYVHTHFNAIISTYKIVNVPCNIDSINI